MRLRIDMNSDLEIAETCKRIIGQTFVDKNTRDLRKHLSNNLAMIFSSNPDIMITCNEMNNPPSVADQDALQVDVYITRHRHKVHIAFWRDDGGVDYEVTVWENP